MDSARAWATRWPTEPYLCRSGRGDHGGRDGRAAGVLPGRGTLLLHHGRQAVEAHDAQADAVRALHIELGRRAREEVAEARPRPAHIVRDQHQKLPLAHGEDLATRLGDHGLLGDDVGASGQAVLVHHGHRAAGRRRPGRPVVEDLQAARDQDKRRLGDGAGPRDVVAGHDVLDVAGLADEEEGALAEVREQAQLPEVDRHKGELHQRPQRRRQVAEEDRLLGLDAALLEEVGQEGLDPLSQTVAGTDVREMHAGKGHVLVE
mmetsp:Transcript_80566/g.254316  ORF Transcript_80566/g.254316 Transcript_80566/m.254316 type:complete len:262 (+) Transcript_80566:200-985(+)